MGSGTAVNLQIAYDLSDASPTPQIALDTTRDAFHVDGAALPTGTAGNNDGPDYLQITRGAVNVLNTSFNAVDSRALIYSNAINGFDVGPDPAIVPNRSTITVRIDQLQFLREDRTFTSAASLAGGRFTWTSALSISAAVPLLSRTFGGFITLAGDFIFEATANPFGMGNALLHAATWKNATGVVANLGPNFLFANNAIYQADAAAITMSQARIFFDNSTYNTIGGGTLTGGSIGHVSFFRNLTVNAGVTLPLVRSHFVQPMGGTGAVTLQIGTDIGNLVFATTNIGIRCNMTAAGANRLLDFSAATSISEFGGDLHMNNGVSLVLGTPAGNRVELLRPLAGVMRMIGVGGTFNEGLDWDFDTAAANVIAVTSTTAARLQVNLTQFAFGTTAPSGSPNFFGLFAPASLRTPGVAGEYSDILFSESGNLDINGLAMSNVDAWRVGAQGITLSGGSIVDIATLRVPNMTTSGIGAALSASIFCGSRLVCRGSLNLGVISASIGADVDDYTGMGTGNSQRAVLRITATGAARTITGFDISATTVRINDTIWIVNVGTNNVVLAHQNAGSVAANRIISPTGANLTLGADESAILWYDDTTARWRIFPTTGA